MESLNHTTKDHTSVDVAKQVSTGLVSVCFLLGFPGNICVVVFILRHFKKDNFTMHLMLNLATSDILCLTTLPWFIYNANMDWIFGRALCKLLFLLALTGIYAGLFTVTLLSVQRYLMVLHRNQWDKLGRKGERILLFSIWILALIFSSPDAAAGDISEEQNCERITVSELTALAILLYESLLGFVFPLSIIVSCYCRLYKKVNRTAFFSNQRLTKLVTAIVLTFVILWTPLHVINLVRILTFALPSTNPVSNKLMSFWESSHTIVKSLAFVNSCMNPLLYVCSSRQLFQNSERPQGFNGM